MNKEINVNKVAYEMNALKLIELHWNYVESVITFYTAESIEAAKAGYFDGGMDGWELIPKSDLVGRNGEYCKHYNDAYKHFRKHRLETEGA